MEIPDDIEGFVREFEAGSLVKSRWTHEAHLLVALWYLAHHPPGEALRIVRGRIRAYNDAVGTPNSDVSGYHETLTRLYLHGLAQHRAAAPAETVAESFARLRDTPLAKRDWPLAFYSKDRLFSVEARRDWVEPDQRPLP